MNILAIPMHSHRLLSILVLFFVCLLASGCRSEYRLEMSVENGVMERAVISRSEEDSPPEPETVEPGMLPEGLGEYGWYLHEDTAMGSLNYYVEQFDGFTDPSASLDMRRFAVQCLVDLWIAWLDSEFAGEPGYAGFRAFVDTEIRADIEDLFFIVWGYGAFGPSLTKFDDQGDATLFGEMAVRGLTYLAMRGYFDLGDARDVIAAFGRSNKYGNYAALADFWAAAIARRMGLEEDAPLPYPLSTLHDQPHRLAGSYNYFVEEGLAMRELVAQWEREYPDYVAEQKPEPAKPAVDEPATPEPILEPPPGEDLIEVIVPPGDFEPIDSPAKIDFHEKYGPERPDATLVMYAVGGAGIDLGGTGTGLNAVLEIPAKPLWTNANVIDGHRMEWSETFVATTFYSNEMSTILYAAWAEPQADYQVRKFGKIVLEDEDLAGYVLWHMQLKPHHAREWDNFIDGLVPGQDIERKLRLFHFSDEPDSVVEILPEFDDEQQVVGEIVRNTSIAEPGARDIIRSLRYGDEHGAQ